MSSQRRIFEIYLPRFVVAATAVVSVLWSFRLTMTNVVAGAAGLAFVETGRQSLAWLAGHGTKGGPADHPLYGILILILSALVGELDLAGVLVSFLSWAATIPLFFFVCKRLNGVKAAYLSTVLLCSNRWMISFSYVMSQWSLQVLLSISCLLVSTELVGLLRSHRSRVSRRLLILSGLTGLLFLLLFLTHPEGFGIFACVLVFLGLWAVVQRRIDIGVAIIVMIAVLLVISGPYFLFVKSYRGYWFFTTQKGYVDRALKGASVALERTKDGEYFRGYYLDNAVKFYEIYREMLGPVGVAMIVLLGLMRILPPITLSKARLEQLLPLLFLTPLLALSTIAALPTYAIPYLPILLMWVGRGAIELGQGLRKRHAALAIATVLIALSVFNAKEVRVWPHSHLHLTFKAIGVWMEQDLAGELENETILGEKGAYIASFYANTNFASSISLEISDPEQAVEYMKANNIQYLLVDAHYTPSHHPNLAFLLTDFEAARNLGLSVVREEQGRTNKSVLYEVQLDTPR